MRFLINGGLLILLMNAVVVMCFPAIGGPTLEDRSDHLERARTVNLNAFDLLGLFGRRGGFLRPILQNTIGNGNTMTLQTGITLLTSLLNGFPETGASGGGSNKDGLLGFNFI